MSQGIAKPRVIWLLIRDDAPAEGEWFSGERAASLKAIWVRQSSNVNVKVVKATIDDDDLA